MKLSACDCYVGLAVGQTVAVSPQLWDCPNCAATLDVPPRYEGQRVCCHACGATVEIVRMPYEQVLTNMDIKLIAVPRNPSTERTGS